MAKNRIDAVLTVDTKTGIVSVKRLSAVINEMGSTGSKSLKTLGKDTDDAGEKFKNLGVKAGVALASIVAGYMAIKKAASSAMIGAKAMQEVQAFKNMAESHGASSAKILADLKQVSLGALSTAEIINAAGRAMMMGIAPERLSDLMQIARVTARQTGQSVSQAFQDIALAVGRQSRMILDNLGIIVDVGKANEAYAEKMKIVGRELTETEKKQAFMNATLSGGQELIKRIGGEGITTAEAFQQFGSQIKDLKVNLSILLAEGITPLIGPMIKMITFLNSFLVPETKGTKELNAELAKQKTQLEFATTQVQMLTMGYKELTKVQQRAVDLKVAAQLVNQAAASAEINDIRRQIDLLGEKEERLKKIAEARAAALAGEDAVGGQRAKANYGAAITPTAAPSIDSAELLSQTDEIIEAYQDLYARKAALRGSDLEAELAGAEAEYQAKRYWVEQAAEEAIGDSEVALETRAVAYEELEVLLEEHEARKDAIKKKYAQEDAKRLWMQSRMQQQFYRKSAGYTQQGLLAIASLVGSDSKRSFERQKKLKMAAATIGGIEAAVHAFRSGMETPGPHAPAVAAAYVTASLLATTAQVAAISKQTFAKGGVFTDSVVDSPTDFRMGQMGEEGPEAIMPLSKDASGRLGVTVSEGTAQRMLQQSIYIVDDREAIPALDENDVVLAIADDIRSGGDVYRVMQQTI